MEEQEKQNITQNNDTLIADLEPNSEAVGGIETGVLTLDGNTDITATQGHGIFILSTGLVGR